MNKFQKNTEKKQKLQQYYCKNGKIGKNLGKLDQMLQDGQTHFSRNPGYGNYPEKYM